MADRLFRTWHYRDRQAGNVFQIEELCVPAFKGASPTMAYRVTAQSEYDGYFTYHVSMHETLAEAREQVRLISTTLEEDESWK